MTGAMYAAVAGLKTHMSALNVIGNNVANVNTNAYKSTRYVFSEALYTSVHSGSDGTASLGGRNPAQVGYGVSVGTIDLDMSTKSYMPTGNLLDCMIDGDGFFIVGDKTKTGIMKQEDLEGMSLSRLGNFQFIDGYLVDGEGQVIYGFLDEEYNAAEAGEPEDLQHRAVPLLTPIRLPKMYETKDADGNTKINIVYPKLVTTGTAPDEITTMRTPTTYGDLIKTVEDGGMGLGLTMENFPQGTSEDDELKWVVLENLNIDKTGVITGVTDDDQKVTVGFVGLAKVDNPNGVTHVDGHYYKALGGAGHVSLCTAGGGVQFVPGTTAEGETATWQALESSQIVVTSAGSTTIINGGLEMAGTDLATEISNMIMIQRGYQANTRIVTVTDSMLEELVNMKR